MFIQLLLQALNPSYINVKHDYGIQDEPIF